MLSEVIEWCKVCLSRMELPLEIGLKHRESVVLVVVVDKDMGGCRFRPIIIGGGILIC